MIKTDRNSYLTSKLIAFIFLLVALVIASLILKENYEQEKYLKAISEKKAPSNPNDLFVGYHGLTDSPLSFSKENTAPENLAKKNGKRSLQNGGENEEREQHQFDGGDEEEEEEEEQEEDKKRTLNSFIIGGKRRKAMRPLKLSSQKKNENKRKHSDNNNLHHKSSHGNSYDDDDDDAADRAQSLKTETQSPQTQTPETPAPPGSSLSVNCESVLNITMEQKEIFIDLALFIEFVDMMQRNETLSDNIERNCISTTNISQLSVCNELLREFFETKLSFAHCSTRVTQFINNFNSYFNTTLAEIYFSALTNENRTACGKCVYFMENVVNLWDQSTGIGSTAIFAQLISALTWDTTNSPESLCSYISRADVEKRLNLSTDVGTFVYSTSETTFCFPLISQLLQVVVPHLLSIASESCSATNLLRYEDCMNCIYSPFGIGVPPFLTQIATDLQLYCPNNNVI